MKSPFGVQDLQHTWTSLAEVSHLVGEEEKALSITVAHLWSSEGAQEGTHTLWEGAGNTGMLWGFFPSCKLRAEFAV